MPLVSWLAYSSTQTMEAGNYSETSIDAPRYMDLISIKLIFILFICSLFNDAVSKPDYIASKNRICKECWRNWSGLNLRYYFGISLKNSTEKKLRWDNLYPEGNLNPWALGYKTRLIAPSGTALITMFLFQFHLSSVHKSVWTAAAVNPGISDVIGNLSLLFT
jgi:hypothetical protein